MLAGTACGCRGLVAAYADRLGANTQRGITGLNLGVPGDTTVDLLSSPRTDRHLSAAVAAGDIVIVTAGANELLPQQQPQEVGGCSA